MSSSGVFSCGYEKGRGSDVGIRGLCEGYERSDRLTSGRIRWAAVPRHRQGSTKFGVGDTAGLYVFVRERGQHVGVTSSVCCGLVAGSNP